MIKLKVFNSEHSKEFVDVWNQIFSYKPKFTPITVEKLHYIITKPNYIKFEDTILLLIYLDNELIGFFHYFLIPDVLRENFFDIFSKDLQIILICNFGIVPSQRSKGIATEVMKYILNQYGKPSIIYPTIFKDDYTHLKGNTTPSCVAVFDTKNISNFWSNTLYPDEILWGHPEGIGINEDDFPTKKFIQKFSLLPLKNAIELKLFPITLYYAQKEKQEYHIVTSDNLEPRVNQTIDVLQPFNTKHYSKTFMALDKSNKVLGYIIVFPLKSYSNEKWGIYELNVGEKKKGIGSALLNESLKFLKNNGCKELYTVTIPAESQEALEFYKKFGFQKVQTWLV